MAQQTIGIGTTPNDGTGDALRTAFGKANDNFDELYSDKADASALAEKLDADAIDTDSTFAANSDEKVPSQKAVKAAIDAILGAWTTYTPTLSSSSGTITTVASTYGRYKKIGDTVTIAFGGKITTNGTGTGQVRISLPFAAINSGSIRQMFVGAELGSSGKSVQAYAGPGETTAKITFLDFSYPGADGAEFNLSGSYEAG